MQQYSPSSERNWRPILSLLRHHLDSGQTVLEIGSGTGQHAVYFARELPQVVWQPSDLSANHASINAWIAESGLDNVLAPLTLDVQARQWPALSFDSAFSANTAHIMSWSAVQAMYERLAEVLRPGAKFFLYGPFSYSGRHTAPSNAAFDSQLRMQDPQMGIRDLEALRAHAQVCGFSLLDDQPMPANNRLLLWSL